jgi:thioredoxin 1
MKQLLYFSGTWCQPCKTFRPIIESLTSEIPIVFIDVDASSQTAQQYNIRSVPTTVLIKDGIEIGRIVGVKSANDIRSLYNR